MGDYWSSLFSVDSRKPESLADFVRRVRAEKGFSTTDVERNSRAGGEKGISDAYVTRIENGQVTNVSPEKLSALARGLKVPEEELFAAVRGKFPAPLNQTGDDEQALRNLMLYYFDNVPEECRLDMLASAKGIYERRNINAKIHERASARAATREVLKTDINEHTNAATRRREAALSPHPSGEELVPGRIVMQDADTLAGDDVSDENNTERERKRA